MRMKHAVLTISIICILLGSSFGIIATTTDKQLKKEVMVTFDDLTIKENSEGTTFELEGSNDKLIKYNHYIVPTYIETYTFPMGTIIEDINCKPDYIQSHSISNKLAVPPRPVMQGMQEKNLEMKESKPISIKRWYDVDIGCGIKDNIRCIIVKIQVYPIKYYPNENTILHANHFDISIDYTIPKSNNVQIQDEYDYIILSPTKYISSLNPLVDHKNNKGISTKLVSLDDINNGIYFPPEGRDEPETIKYFIKNAVEQWNTNYVLLVGGYEDFPVRATNVFVDYNEGDAEIFASDLYFADIYDATGGFSSWDTNENDAFGEYNWSDDQFFDDVDLYPDVYLGRLACVDVDEVDTCVNKIITYETSEAYKTDWFTKLVLIGGDTSPNDEEGVLEGEFVNQHVIDIMNGFIPTKCWASEGTLGSPGFIDNAINDGCGFIDFSGHGNPSLWATHPFNQPNVWIPVGNYKNNDVLDLENGEKLPVVVTGACSVAKFTVSPRSFCWSFMSNPDGGGIASFGPAALSWGYDTSYTVQALGGRMQLELFKAYKEHGAITAGEMWVKAISNYIYPEMDSGDHKTVEEWQPFIDPTLSIAEDSQPPNKPNINGPTSGKVGDELTYEASTTDVEGDMIYYLFDWGDGTFSNWIGPVDSGQSVSASHIWETEGDFDIRVTAKDDHGVQSDWSDPLQVTMPKNKVRNHPIFDWIVSNFPMLEKLFF